MLQVYKRMFQAVMPLKNLSEGAGSTDAPNKGVASNQLGDFIRNNKDQIKTYFSQLDKDGNGIDYNDMNNSNQRFDTNALLRELGLSKLDYNGQKLALGDIVSTIDAYDTGKAATINTAIQHQGEVSNALPTVYSKYVGSTDTMSESRVGVSEIERTTYSDSYVTDLDENAFVSKERLQDKTNYNMFNSILREMSSTDIKDLLAALPSEYMENPGKQEFKNIMKGRKEYAPGKKIEYKDKGGLFDFKGFSKNERDAIYKALQSYTTMSSAPRDKKMLSLLDFNGDMKIDAQLVAVAGEGQMRELIKKTPNGFNNVLANLGLSGLDLNGNFFVAREKFQTALSNAVASGLKPAVLVQKDGVTNYVAEQLKNQELAAQQVAEEVEKLLLTDDRLSYLPAADRRRAIDAVKLEAVGMIIGNRSAVGASFDVRGLTKDLIDNASIGMMQSSDGTPVPGIALSRNIVNKKLAGRNVRVDAGAASAISGGIKFVPFVNVAGEIIPPSANLEGLFDKDIKAGASLSGFVNISAKLSAGLVLSRVDEGTSLGINAMVDQMDSTLAQVLSDVQAGNIFSSANYEGKTEADRDMYEQIKGLYERGARKLTTDSQRLVYLASLKNGYMENYASELHDNAEGYKLTGVGLSYLAGCFPVPSIHGEKIYHKFVENNNDVGTRAEQVISRRESSLAELGGVIGEMSEELGGHRVLFIPNITEVYAGPEVQVVRHGSAGVSISGDLRGLCLKVNTHAGTRGENRVLYIEEATATRNTELVFAGNPTEGITSDVMIDSGIPETTDTRPKSQFGNMEGWTWVQTEAARASVAGAPTAVSEHMVISENISEEFKAVMRAIDSTVNVGWIGKSGTPTLMAEFQEMVYASQQLESDRRLSESNVDRAYNFLVKNMLENGIAGRSPSSWAGVKLPDALAEAGVLETIKSASTRKEKMMVIESVMLALRNDASTKGESFSDSYAVAGGKTLEAFSTQVAQGSVNTRFEVFSNVLAKDLGIRKELISQAQRDYLKEFVFDQNGNQVFNTDGSAKTIGQMKELKTAFIYNEASASTTAASQLNKNGIKGGVHMDNGVQEYVVNGNGTVVEVSIWNLSTQERDHRIDSLSADFLAAHLNEVNAHLGTNMSMTEFKQAIKQGQASTNGKSVNLNYAMKFALTGNCLNDHIRETVSIEKVTMVEGTGSVAIEERGYYQRATEGLQVQETTTSGTNTAVYGSTAAAVGFNFDGGGKEDDASTNPGEEPEVDASTNPNEDGVSDNISDSSNDSSGSGTTGGGTDGGDLLGGSSDATNTTENGMNGTTGGIDGGPVGEATPVNKKGSILSGLGFGTGTMKTNKRNK